ncbi:hypothetical protein C0991_007073, partial [Blastosporella zonata]
YHSGWSLCNRHSLQSRDQLYTSPSLLLNLCMQCGQSAVSRNVIRISMLLSMRAFRRYPITMIRLLNQKYIPSPCISNIFLD